MFLFNCWALFAIECTILSYSPRNCLFRSDNDFVFIHHYVNEFEPIVGEYDTTGEDFQSIKVLGKVLLNEYMVPFEFASILLLAAMIGTVLLSKKEKLQK